ncbi:MFS transporter [Saccharomonospora halophila]|uniref:MFS transporter n=1 Tax=Saccharomonospora halophila TaxID=129922 RepID=UPI000361F4F3|nr:MFS transporter [Saccharomonospora halophila]
MARRSALIGLLAAEGISIMGSRMSLIALPWLVLTTTGSPALTGIVAAGETVPYVLAGALGSPLVDRFGARRASLLADWLSAAVLGAVPFLYHLGPALLLTLVFVVGGLRGLSDLAKRVLLPHTVRDATMPMTRATALYDGVHRFSALVGGPVAGVLIAWFGAPVVIGIDAGSFAVCAVVVMLTIRRRPDDGDASSTRDPHSPPEDREPYWTALRRGFRHLRRDRLMLSVMAIMFLVNLFDTAALSVYLPVWAEQIVGSPLALGLCSGAFAAGALVGNVGIVAFTKRIPRYATLVTGLLIGGAPRFLAVGTSDSMLLVTLVMFVAGLGLAAVNPIITAVLYERTPTDMQARVFGTVTATAFAGMPLGSLLAAWSMPSLGFTASLLLTAALFFAATVAPLLDRRTWRQVGSEQRSTNDDRSRPDAARTPTQR